MTVLEMDVYYACHPVLEMDVYYFCLNSSLDAIACHPVKSMHGISILSNMDTMLSSSVTTVILQPFASFNSPPLYAQHVAINAF
jgi:hypothetical protein